LGSHGSDFSASRSKCAALGSNYGSTYSGSVCVADGISISGETAANVVDSLISSNFLVGFSDWSSPRAVRAHVHPDSVDNVVVTSETGLLRVRLLRDHGTFGTLCITHVVNHRVKLVKLFENFSVVFVVLNFISKRLREDLNESLFKSSELVSIKFTL
jgi:hypothetical protein